MINRTSIRCELLKREVPVHLGKVCCEYRKVAAYQRSGEQRTEESCLPQLEVQTDYARASAQVESPQDNRIGASREVCLSKSGDVYFPPREKH